VREVMRIQSVPDKFELPDNMTLSSKFKTISNGVPVVLAKEIAQSISNFIE
ncbi:DNA cytosine methyltransferase, partial [Salmonella enterica]|nr:DNA cytosine methyltransferase [Salmonella enterica]